jgi:hypothetical protein
MQPPPAVQKKHALHAESGHSRRGFRHIPHRSALRWAEAKRTAKGWRAREGWCVCVWLLSEPRPAQVARRLDDWQRCVSDKREVELVCTRETLNEPPRRERKGRHAALCWAGDSLVVTDVPVWRSCTTASVTICSRLLCLGRTQPAGTPDSVSHIAPVQTTLAEYLPVVLRCRCC